MLLNKALELSFSTSLGGANVKLAMEPSINLYEMHLGADLAGVKVNYEQENSANDSHKIISVGGSLAGVDFSYTDSRSDDATGVRMAAAKAATAAVAADVNAQDKNEEQNMTISTNVGGMKVEYQKMESQAGTTSDGFFGTFSKATLLEAEGFGITTSLAGNTVQIRSYETTAENVTNSDDDSASAPFAEESTVAVDAADTLVAPTVKRDTKIIVTRPLASGATAEFTYVTGDSATSMDLEFRMKF